MNLPMLPCTAPWWGTTVVPSPEVQSSGRVETVRLGAMLSGLSRKHVDLQGPHAFERNARKHGTPFLWRNLVSHCPGGLDAGGRRDDGDRQHGGRPPEIVDMAGLVEEHEGQGDRRVPQGSTR